MDQLPLLISCSSILKPRAQEDRHPGVIRERAGAGGKDKTAEKTLLSLHLQYSMHGNLGFTLGTVLNCIRNTEISVIGTKYANLGTGLKPVTYFTG